MDYNGGAWYRSMDHLLRSAKNVLDEAVEQWNVEKFVVMTSGGNDSMAALAITDHFYEVETVAHIATGTGIQETQDYVESLVELGFNVKVYRPDLDEILGKGAEYRRLVLEQRNGFPGAYAHRFMYRQLKEKPIRKILADHKEYHNQKIGFVTGVRRQESAQRDKRVKPIWAEGCRIWTAPIFEWSKNDCRKYVTTRGWPRNPVPDFIHMSGECLCGAYARPGELDEIRMWYPAAAAAIEKLQEAVKAAGIEKCEWGWQNQKKGAVGGPLCVGCQG